MTVFTLEIHSRKAGSHDHAFQERQIVAALLTKVAGAIGSGTEHEGEIVYDGTKVGTWAFGDTSHVYRERVKGDGPGTAAANKREAAVG